MRIPRKMEHVQHALRLGQSGRQGLSDVQLIHNCLPEASMNDIALDTDVGGLAMSSPIIINAMTGGASETEAINRDLAVAARECGLAMAVGSQMSAIRHKETESSYTIVRKMNPHGLVFANLGSEATLEQAQKAVEMIQADALQIHLNVMQELIMPEGDRNFKGMLERIQRIVEGLSVPVIVKEVGFGIMAEEANRLRDIGVRIVDVGGSGGTNFAAIENLRRDVPLQWLNDWGSKTSITVLEAVPHYEDGWVIASGGITNGLEACKSIALGASAVGVAGSFLRVLNNEGTSALVRHIENMKEHMKMVMTALGTTTISELQRARLIVRGETAEWCALRGIDTYRYARRPFSKG